MTTVIDETTPLLLSVSGGDETDSIQVDKIRKLRSNSTTKWKILLWISILFLIKYHIMCMTSALEDNLISKYNLSSLQFSLFSTLYYVSAIPACLLLPKLLNKYSIYTMSIISSVTMFFGTLIFVLGTLPYCRYLWLLYIGRFFQGLSFGLNAELLLVGIWFDLSKWLPLANACLYSTSEIGMLLTRYFVFTVYTINDNITQPYLLSLGASLFALLFSYLIYLDNKKFNAAHNIPSSTARIKSFSIFSYIDAFKLKAVVWFLIFYYMLGYATVDTFTNLMVEPLMNKFQLTEGYANFILMICGVYNLFFSLVAGAVASSSQQMIHYFLFIGPAIIMASCFLFIYANVEPNGWASKHSLPWIFTILYNTGTQFCFTAVGAFFYTYTPPALQRIAMSILTAGYFIATVFFTAAFGQLQDMFQNNYVSSIWLINAIGMIILLISFPTETAIRFSKVGLQEKN